MLPERYIPRKIAQLSKTDRKVSVIGRVVELRPDGESFIIDDESGKIEIFFEKENLEGREMVGEGRIICAFCTLVGEHLKLDIAQSLDGVDLNLLKTVDDLYSKAGL